MPIRKHQRLSSSDFRRTAINSFVVLTIAASGLSITIRSSAAQAADSFTCTGPAAFFNATTSGTLQRRQYSTPGRAGGTWTTPTTPGTGGWQNFGRILGGPDGRIYGINSNGLHRYRWTGTTWENHDGKQGPAIHTGFTQFASAVHRDKITVDELGDFYLIDGNGVLRWYRYAESTKTWPSFGRVLDTGWNKYNLLVATSPGVLYARATSDGRVYRYRFDPVSQRWLDRDRLVGGTGFANFTKGLFSAGDDTLYGIQTNGDLQQFRYREDILNWELTYNRIGTGWGFPNVFTMTNACHQGAISSPARPPTPIQPDSSITVVQAPSATTARGTLEIAFADNIGQLRHGRANPDSLGTIQWSAVPGVDAYTGKPAVVADAQDRVNLFAHEVTSDIATLRQKTVAMPDWEPWLGLGGAMRSGPAVVRLSDNTMALFAFDADGLLWQRQMATAEGFPPPWSPVAGGGLTGTTSTPVVVAGADGAATIFAVTAAGAVVTATWRAGALTSGWVNLGSTGFTGTPSATVLPGRRVMVIAGHADGSVGAQLQNTDGTWPGSWTTVGDTSITPAGPPSAALSPTTGRMYAFVRAPDGVIHASWQIVPGSATWSPWTDASSGLSYTTDPTAFTWQNGEGQQIGFATRNVNLSVRIFWVNEAAQSSAPRTNRASAGAPTFSGRDIPGPPNR